MKDEEFKKDNKTSELPDSFSMGSATKGGSLKVYFNVENPEQTERKIKNILKVREMLQRLGVEIQ